MADKLKNCCSIIGCRMYEYNMHEEEMRPLLEKAIKQAINDGYSIFMSDMERGVGRWAANIVLNEKKRNPEIVLICVVPDGSQATHWDRKEEQEYDKIIKNADYIKNMYGLYEKNSVLKRRFFMVDCSARIVAAYTDKKGETLNVIRYAKLCDTEIINILSPDFNK